MNLSFVIGLGLFALFQLFASVFILMFNNSKNAIRSTYYASILGLVSSLAIGVYLSIEAANWNALIRDYSKQVDPLPKLMPFYRSIQIGATASLLLIFPMMGFTFYHKLQKRVALDRIEGLNKDGSSKSCQGWGIVLFWIQNSTLIACIFVFIKQL